VSFKLLRFYILLIYNMDKLADILSTFFVTSQNYRQNKKDPDNSIKNVSSKKHKTS
jgi:hypothetical protein